MPASNFTMWGMLILMAFGAAVSAGVFHGNIFSEVRAAYPSDTAKRDALHRCGQLDTEFSRFSEHDREVCYHAVLPSSAQIGPAAAFDMLLTGIQVHANASRPQRNMRPASKH